ncbi:MAG TPA: 2-C-methyl-D-erythritol 4-phosphate cytidylyltransferase [Deltaproteobacteria bacterium]|nr:2-C-methyl-D-erythritol 4-phosphate cytidylyltransferase [Deltaproteobacteria bacterium]
MEAPEEIRSVAVIPAAGRGRRAGDRMKVYRPICGRPALAWTLDAFERCYLVDAVVVVAARDDVEYCLNEIVEKEGFGKVRMVIAGGRERQDSVAGALRRLREEDWDCVVVHDGARPLVRTDLIEDVVMAGRLFGAATAAVPVKDTVKEVRDGVVVRTIPREDLWAVQTPQAFRLDLLNRAHSEAAAGRVKGTDDAMLVERLGAQVRIVDGDYDNIKVTTACDFAVAEALLAARLHAEKGECEGR